MSFEGCMPIEVMAGRGIDTMRYGPMKPVGLELPGTGELPYAVVQLRQDNAVPHCTISSASRRTSSSPNRSGSFL